MPRSVEQGHTSSRQLWQFAGVWLASALPAKLDAVGAVSSKLAGYGVPAPTAFGAAIVCAISLLIVLVITRPIHRPERSPRDTTWNAFWTSFALAIAAPVLARPAAICLPIWLDVSEHGLWGAVPARFIHHGSERVIIILFLVIWEEGIRKCVMRTGGTSPHHQLASGVFYCLLVSLTHLPSLEQSPVQWVTVVAVHGIAWTAIAHRTQSFAGVLVAHFVFNLMTEPIA